jgi:hypothetical protein
MVKTYSGDLDPVVHSAVDTPLGGMTWGFPASDREFLEVFTIS